MNSIRRVVKSILDIRNSMSLRTKFLIAYLVVIVFSSTIAGYLTTQRIGQDMMSQSINNEKKAVLQLSENIKNLLDKYIYLSNDIIFNNKISEYFLTVRYYPGKSEKIFYEEIEPTFVKYRNLIPELRKITIYTQNTEIPTNSDEITYLVPGSPESKLYEEVAKRKGKALWLWRKNPGGTDCVTLNRIYYVGNQEIGMLSIFIDPKYISNFIKENTEESNIYIIDPEGLIVSSTSSGMAGVRITGTGLDSPGADGTLTVKDIKIGDTRLETIYNSFDLGKDSPSQWKIIKAVPYKVILQSINAEKARQLLIFAISGLIAALLSYLIARSLGKSIKVLIRGMEKLQEGDFSVSVNFKRTDEIGYLGNSFNTMVKKLNELINEVYQMKMLQMEMEVKRKEAENYALQSQINPHFLFNTLDTIIYGIMEGRQETAQIVKLLGKSFRRTLQWKNDFVSIEDEINFIKEYLTIQKFRFEDKLNWNIHIPDDLLGIRIPKLILQPIVENSIHHGLSMKKNGGTLWISAKKEDEKTVIRIEDDGIGIEESKLKEILYVLDMPSMNTTGSNIGLKNVYDRIKLHYGENSCFNISSSVNCGTYVEIALPV